MRSRFIGLEDPKKRVAPKGVEVMVKYRPYDVLLVYRHDLSMAEAHQICANHTELVNLIKGCLKHEIITKEEILEK